MPNTLQKKAWLILCTLALFFAACKKPAGNNPNPGPGTNPGNATLELTSFLPVKGMPQTEVKIKGKHFNTTKAMNEVRFGGTLTQVVAATADELTVTVPAGATTGKITVKVGSQTATSATDFTVDQEVTRIIDFTPKEGPLGTEVTITGSLFGDNITVKINGIIASLKQRSATSIVFQIPVNTSLTAHKIQVTSGTDVLETAADFTVTNNGALGEWVDLNKGFALSSAFPYGVTFVYKNKIYWGFSYITFSETLSDCLVYDPAEHDKGWVFQARPPADMAPAKRINSTAVAYQDRVFFGMGFLQTSSSDWWEFKPESNTATRLTDYPEKTSGAISFVLDGNIYAGFGDVNKQLYKFNPAGNGTWQSVVTGTFKEMTNATVFVLGNDAYIGNALLTTGGIREAMFRFTAPDKLVQVTNMPAGLNPVKGSFVIGNKGYLVGQRTVWEYSPDAAGGTYRAVISTTDGPIISHVAELMVNGVKEIYGWTSGGRLYKFRFK